MNDPFDNRIIGLNGPARDLLPVTPDDGATLPQVATGLYIESGGSLSVVTVTGQSRSLTVTDFSILPVGIRQVHATGTSASGLHAFVVG